jgi:predicted molibdopterin-dependent oxidoreductase YjgC
MTGIVRITVDGRPLEVPAGRSIAAALMLEQQRMGWRGSRATGSLRGVFCGIGVCFDCTAAIDGTHGLRTCLVEAADGMVVETSAQPPSIPDLPEPAQEAADDA